MNLIRVDIFLHEIGTVEESMLKNEARSEEFKNFNTNASEEKYFKELIEKKRENAELFEKNRIVAKKLKEELNLEDEDAPKQG